MLNSKASMKKPPLKSSLSPYYEAIHQQIVRNPPGAVDCLCARAWSEEIH